LTIRVGALIIVKNKKPGFVVLIRLVNGFVKYQHTGFTAGDELKNLRIHIKFHAHRT